MNKRYLSEWGSCPLDVEALARYSVNATSAAAQLLGNTRGLDCEISSHLPQIPFAFSSLERLKINRTSPEVWGDFSGFFRTSDGWIRFHGNYPHHATAIKNCLGVKNRKSLEKELAQSSKYDIEESIIQAGGVAAAVRGVAEWRNHPQEHAMESTPWASCDVQNRSSGNEFAAYARMPAEGIKVLDLTRVVAGPTCSQILACLGADVLRIDPPMIPEIESQFISNGMGKKSAIIDFSKDEKVLRSLLREAQVLIMGYSPGSLDKFGLSLEKLRNDYPDLLIANLSAWGDVGSWNTRAGFDSIVQAATGISEICGKLSSDGDFMPGALPVQALDHCSGFIMAKHILESLSRQVCGVIKVSLLGAARELIKLDNKNSTFDEELHKGQGHMCDIDTPYGVVSVPLVPIILDGKFIRGKIRKYGSSVPSWGN